MTNRFIDLFCGIGGFRLALEQYGLQCVFSSEIDQHSRRTYAKNFNEIPSGDITQINASDIPNHDILCAGFPCQSFSLAGKKQGFSGEKGHLFFDIVRIAKYHKPKILLLENVKNILSIHDGAVLRTIYQQLEAIGYRVSHCLLNASFYGIPQARKRVYFVAIRKDLSLTFTPPEPTYEQIFLADVLLPKKQTKHLEIQRDDIVTYNTSKQQSLFNIGNLKPLRLGSFNKTGQGSRIYGITGHAITLSGVGGGLGGMTGLYLNRKHKQTWIFRRLHIEEAKAVMGFPCNHYVSDGYKGYRQLGNAVIPRMIKQVYQKLGKPFIL